ncbi:NUDIX hydrolase [Halonatronum saccharophilum]|uniref:NUDIX hydrolase n=1 Tax=Halonatronum saccharophilum TaxID=150060 RepID=UPI000487AB4B|nr:NUDIX hydrolase [Halonatronum saccharophilum]
MNNLREKTIKSTKVYEGEIVNLRIEEVELPDRSLANREIIDHSGAVAIIPYNNGKVIMVEQFRKATDSILLEIPAGRLEGGEKPKDCALRELEEETGYKAESLNFINDFYTTPGFTNEVIYLYLATDLEKYEQNTDPGEFINIKEYSLEEIKVMLREGKIKDAKTIIGIQCLLNELSYNY